MTSDTNYNDHALLAAEQRHRTANVLHMVAALLSRKATVGGAAGLALLEAEAQLRAFALVDGMLRLDDAASQTKPCLARYIRELCAHLDAACLAPRGIVLRLTLDETMPVPERTCRNVGLILTELVLNAVKHAWPAVGDATLTIIAGHMNSDLRVIVRDDGCGGATGEPMAGHGLALAHLLAGRIGGVLERRDVPVGRCVELAITG